MKGVRRCVSSGQRSVLLAARCSRRASCAICLVVPKPTRWPEQHRPSRVLMSWRAATSRSQLRRRRKRRPRSRQLLLQPDHDGKRVGSTASSRSARAAKSSCVASSSRVCSARTAAAEVLAARRHRFNHLAAFSFLRRGGRACCAQPSRRHRRNRRFSPFLALLKVHKALVNGAQDDALPALASGSVGAGARAAACAANND